MSRVDVGVAVVNKCELTCGYKSSAVSEMGDCFAIKDVPKSGGLLCPLPWGSWVRI